MAKIDELVDMANVLSVTADATVAKVTELKSGLPVTDEQLQSVIDILSNVNVKLTEAIQ